MIRRRRRTFLIFIFIIILLYIFIHSPHSISSSHLTLFDQIHYEDNLDLTPKFCFTKTKKKNIHRAIIVHFPVQRSGVYISELKWLYLSWIETIQNQPNDWQTDLIIYSLPSSFLDELGCYENHNNKLSKNNCFRIHYNSLWDKTTNDSELVRLIQMNIPTWCRHLDSLGILLENSEFLNQYDYILRTDIDVFLTPHFANYIPFDCSFQIGLGGYSLDYTIHKLSRIAQTLNLFDVNITHVGSTWFERKMFSCVFL
jgi:hypothetical protein